VHCEAERGIQPVCGFQNPEDLAVVGGETLLISEMGRMDGSLPGQLVRFDPGTNQRTVLFPSDEVADVAAAAPTPGWGDPECPGSPGAAFSPHGLDLFRRPDGRTGLLVVNHGGRESVELFEVGGTPTAPALEWRGCAIPGEPHFLNDVAALPEGGFVVTHMMPRSGTLGAVYQQLRGSMGFATGYVLEWSEQDGFRPIPGTEGGMPNGVAVSADGRYVFVNLYLAGEVRRVARDGSEPPLGIEVSQPDNLNWAPDGRLLVASHDAGLSEMMACVDLEEGACPIAFAILAIDPTTMAIEPVFENKGAPMGAGTAAVELDGELFIGSFAGDRIIRVSP
jgi:sugar lactone lactonase YvrE